MDTIRIKNTYNKLVSLIRQEIIDQGLLTDELNDLLQNQISSTTTRKTSKQSNTDKSKIQTNYYESVSKNCKMVKSMFKGVVEHKYCLGVSHKMVKIMNNDASLSLEKACYEGAMEMNVKAGREILPMNEESFERMLSELHGCKIIHENDE